MLAEKGTIFMSRGFVERAIVVQSTFAGLQPEIDCPSDKKIRNYFALYSCKVLTLLNSGFNVSTASSCAIGYSIMYMLRSR